MESTLFEIFDPVLTDIDAVLVERGTPLSQRPFDAALLMVRSNIFEFSTDGGNTQYVHDGTAAFAKTEWFRSLYKKVDEWYANRYGATLNQMDREPLAGVILFGTIHQLSSLQISKTAALSYSTGCSFWICAAIWLQISPSHFSS